MQILPREKAARIRSILCLLALGGVIWATRIDRLAGALWSYKPEEGDIVFQSLPHGELVDAIENVTQSPWSHCGILMQKDGKWVVAEAIGEVRETPWTQWVLRSRKRYVEAYRLKNPMNAAQLKRLRAELGSMMGIPYDYKYAPYDDAIYCSELVYKGYERATGLELGQWQELGSLNWKGNEVFIRDMEGGQLPLDRKMVTPVSITKDAKLERVF